MENEIFRPGVVKTVMNGVHYVCGKCGMTLITEALLRLQVSNFLKVSDCSQFQRFFEKIGEVQELFQADELRIRRIHKRLNYRTTGKIHRRVYEIQGGWKIAK